MDAAHGVPWSSLVTTMARNGTEFGIRVSGLGDRWFTGPCREPVRALLLGLRPPRTPTRTWGTARSPRRPASAPSRWPAAPAIVQFVGGTPADALAYTRRMYEITLGESEAYRLPTLDFRGTPTGIDVRLVLADGDPARRSTRASPTASPGSARSAPGSSTRPWRASRGPAGRWRPSWPGRIGAHGRERERAPRVSRGRLHRRAAGSALARVPRGGRGHPPSVGGQQGGLRHPALHAPARPRDSRRVPAPGRGWHAVALHHGAQRRVHRAREPDRLRARRRRRASAWPSCSRASGSSSAASFPT